LFILAALAAGLVALISLPREEEPQISVPLVDIHVQAQGLKAEDAVKLVTEPMEIIVKGINDVEHVYSNTRDDAVMVTARFEVGTKAEDAILRVHEKLRANMDRIPVGIPEPLVIGRGIDDVAILALTLSAAPGQQVSANDLTRLAREVQAELAKTDEVGLTYLVGEASEAIRIAPDPDRLALYGVTLQQLAGKVAQANRTLNTGKLARRRRTDRPGRRPDPAGPGRGGQPAADHARRPPGLCRRRGRGQLRSRHVRSRRPHGAEIGRRRGHRQPRRHAGHRQAGRGQRRGGGRRGAAPAARPWRAA
jgi:multidrug efflux pump subunit AcrB